MPTPTPSSATTALETAPPAARRVPVIVVTTVLLSFISFWRASAIVLSDLGQLDEAESMATDAMSFAAEDDLASQVFGRVALAHVRTVRGQHEDAVALAREAVEMFAHAQTPDLSGQAWFALAHALRGAGHDAEATEAAQTALAFFERKGVLPAADAVRAFISGTSDGPVRP